MKKTITTILAGAMLFTVGCSAKEKGTVYEYDHPVAGNSLRLTKSVYDEDTLTIYHKGTLDDSFSVYSTFDIEYEIDDETVQITYEDIEEITSLVFQNAYYKYEVRYLDSNQYAVLEFSWACDLGWDRIGGEYSDYYTQEELDEQERNRQERQALFDTNWAIVEGTYESDDGEEFGFYVDDNGTRLMLQYGHSYRVYGIFINDNNVTANCLDDPYDYCLEFQIADDGSYVDIIRNLNRVIETIRYYKES